MLPFDFNAVLLKGRANYLSLAKFELALRQKEDNYETALAKMQILVWLTETETGDRDEINLGSGGQLFWERLQSDRYIYSGLQLPWGPYDFYERARDISEKADIIITNNSFLMADIISKDSMIPKSGFLILDEAHQIERAATVYLGKRIDYISVKTLFNRIGTYEQKLMLYRLEKMVKDRLSTEPAAIKILDQAISDFSYELEQLFYILASRADKLSTSAGPQRIPLNRLDNEWANISILVERLMGHLRIITSGLEKRVELLKKTDAIGKNALFFLNETELVTRQIEEISRTFHEFFISPSERSIYWLEYTKAAPHHGISLFSQPASAGRIVWDTFFSGQKSVVMTSATLSVKHSFNFFKSELGIVDSQVETISFPSPFDYNKNLQIIVSKDIPDINAVSLDVFTDSAAAHILAAAKAARGRTMILFTSHEMLRLTYQKVKEAGTLEEFTLLAQGVSGGSRMRLIRNFQTFDKSVLFGTASLWEGVDIPGQDLSCLIIVRLPFSPPDDPITEAKYEVLEAQGKNPFSHYSLPKAILRFRQGFGRLIRTSSDKGILLILDRRIFTAKYGKEFIAAVPPVIWKESNLEDLDEKIKNWLS
jgi:ATP-dependent DNA helicase DinG